MDWLGLTIAVIIMFIGLAGTLLPLLPGAPLIILGMVVYGLFNGFEVFTTAFWLGQIVLLILIFATDYLAGAVGVKRYGGSKAAVWGSITGGVIGFFTFGPLGVLIGPFLGAVIGELITNRPIDQAINAGIGTLLGFAGGTLVKLLLEIVMIVWFFWAVWQ